MTLCSSTDTDPNHFFSKTMLTDDKFVEKEIKTLFPRIWFVTQFIFSSDTKFIDDNEALVLKTHG